MIIAAIPTVIFFTGVPGMLPGGAPIAVPGGGTQLPGGGSLLPGGYPQAAKAAKYGTLYNLITHPFSRKKQQLKLF